MGSATVTVSAKQLGDMDHVLKQLSGEWLGNRVLRGAMGAAAKPLVQRAKELCPPPGYKHDKPGLKPLRDTISWVFREYSRARVAIVGPLAPAGAHGHLVEFGHRMVVGGRVARQWEIRLANTPEEMWTAAQRAGVASWKSRRRRGDRRARPATGTVVGQVAGRPFLFLAATQTLDRQREAFEGWVRRAVRRLAASTEAKE